MKEDSYLIIGNHVTLVGNWEQVEITLKTFHNAGYPIRLSHEIVPNKINIIIEDFNIYLTQDMVEISKTHPKTKFVLYVTEYLTKKYGQLFLNVFSKKDYICRKIALMEVFIFSPISNLLDLSNSSRFIFYLEKIRRRIVRPILNKFFERINKSLDNEIMMARRQKNLFKIAHLFSLCISTTEAVLRGYNKLCSCKLNYLPVFVNIEKTLANRKRNRKLPTIFFSGRMTPYRKLVIDEINISKRKKNSYPLTLINLYPQDVKQDFEMKMNNLATGIFGNKIAKDATKLKKEIFSKNIEIIDITIYELLKKEVNPSFEIYIPQDVKWPYSSPNRTLLSIESGFIPLDYGNFDDHDINEVTITIDTQNISKYLKLSVNDLKPVYENLDKKIQKYNVLQSKKLIDFKNLYSQEVYNLSNIAGVSKEKSSGKSITTG